MKRFVFSLQSVLELREREEEDAKMELASKEGELKTCRDEMEVIRLDLQQFQSDQKNARSTGQGVAALRMSVSWRNKLKLDLLKKAQEMQEIEMDIDRSRAKLLEATKKKKGLELLRDKKLQEWQRLRNRKDQEFLDELATNAHIRKLRES